MPTPQNAGVIPTLTIAGRVFSDTKNLKILRGNIGSNTNRYTTTRISSGSGGYQVPVGYQLRVLAVRIDTVTGAAGSNLTILYSDNDQGIGTTTAPTNPVYMGGAAGSSYITGGITAAGEKETPVDFVIPAGKYLGFDGQGNSISCQVQAYGYLEAV